MIFYRKYIPPYDDKPPKPPIPPGGQYGCCGAIGNWGAHAVKRKT